MQTAKPSTYGGYFVAKASVGERLCGQHESIAIVLHAIKLSASSERWHNQQRSYDHSALAQLVEQLTVNQRVAGSSPAGGAIFLYSIQSLVRTWCNSTLLLKACGNTMETSTFK